MFHVDDRVKKAVEEALVKHKKNVSNLHTISLHFAVYGYYAYIVWVYTVPDVFIGRDN